MQSTDALQLLEQIATSGELGMFASISVEDVSLDETQRHIDIIARCDDSQLVATGRPVHIHVEAEDRLSEGGTEACTLSFSRFQGDVLSFRTILLALKSNVNFGLHTDVLQPSH